MCSTMILWLNGAFGAGKTQTAFELHKRLPNSAIYDPEKAGYFIRDTSPKGVVSGDFQDVPLWRSINADLMSYIHSHYGGTIIVPMTLVNPEYYGQIIGELRDRGIEVRHIVLYASKQTLIKRLRGRLEGGANSWAVQQIDRCLAGFESGIFENRIVTDELTIDEVVEEAARVFDVAIKPRNRNPIARWLGRILNQIKSIR